MHFWWIWRLFSYMLMECKLLALQNIFWSICKLFYYIWTKCIWSIGILVNPQAVFYMLTKCIKLAFQNVPKSWLIFVDIVVTCWLNFKYVSSGLFQEMKKFSLMFVGSSNAFQNRMSQPSSINGHSGYLLQVKGLDPYQVPLGGPGSGTT